jgi:hypothetical protein
MPENPGYDIIHATVNEADLKQLQEQGITSPWYVGTTSGNVMVRLPRGRVPIPVAALIMKSDKTSWVCFKDGNPLNLTRANLQLVPR